MLPYIVRATAEGTWDVIERATGETIGNYPTVRKALNSLLEFKTYTPKASVLHDAKTEKPIGMFRWLDASAVEPEAAADGSQVTEGAIRNMAFRLNMQSQPVLIDGGSTDSQAHASMVDDATRANGWVHVGAEVQERPEANVNEAGEPIWPTGRMHLYLYCELLPDINDDVATGRLAFGSIGWLAKKDDPDNAKLVQHALTNRPAVTGLMPASAIRSHFVRTIQTQLTGSNVILAGRSFRMSLGRPTPTDTRIQMAQRGPAADALSKLFAMFGIDPASEDSHWKLFDMVCALKDGAALETAIAAVTGGGAPAAPAAPAAASAGARAIPGLDTPEAVEAWAGQVLDSLRAALNLPAEADAATVLDQLKAAQDKIAGALAAPPADEAAAAAAAASAAATAAAAAGQPAAASAAVSEATISILQEQLATARTENAALLAEIKPVRETATTTTLSASIRKLVDDKKLVISPERFEKLVEIGKRTDGLSLVKQVLDMTSIAHSGSVMGGASTAQRQAVSGTTTVEGDSPETVIAEHVKAIRKENPKMTETSARREAYKRGKTSHPALFND